MAWNRPTAHEIAESKCPPKILGLRSVCILASFVVAVIIVAYYIVSNSDSAKDISEVEIKSKSLTIPDINTICDTEITTEEKRKEVEMDKSGPDEWKPKPQGFCFDSAGNLYRDGRKIRTSKIEHRKAPCEIFRYHSENTISLLMNTTPGTMFFGPGNYHDSFVANFEKSCLEPIIISSEDSDEVKRLKQDMIDVKIELKDRMRQGESLVDIMSSTRNELQKLGQIKFDLSRILKQEVRESATSAKDVDALIEAADVMLEQKGIAPLRDNPIIRHNLMRIININSDELED